MQMKQADDWDVKTERAELIESLRAHGQLLETSDENATLPPGVTHILIKKENEEPKLVRKRMSSVFWSKVSLSLV